MGPAPSFRTRALTVACTDLRRSERFYRDILGATDITPEPGMGCPWFRLGSLDITLVPNVAERTPAVFPTHAMPILWLEVDDLPKAAEWFAAQGVEVVDPKDGQYLMVADPDGLVIEVWETRPE